MDSIKPPGAAAPAYAHPGRALAVVLAGAFMAGIDVTIVNVALPTIESGIHATPNQLEWVISSYALAFGLSLIPGGRFGDQFGHKRIFMIGLSLFTLASLACGLAQTPMQLIVFRFIQGLAAGLFNPAVSATIRLAYPPAERGKAFGRLGAVFGISTAIGPTLGGLLILAFGEADGWRWIFLVNLPFGIAAVIAAARFLPSHESHEVHKKDPVGLLLLTAGLLLVLIPIIEGQTLGWPLWTFISMLAAIPVFGLLAWWELRVEAAGGEPLIAPQVVRVKAFSAGALVSLVYFAAFTSIFFTITILWQSGLGENALVTGLTTLPFSVASLTGSALSHRFANRMGENVLALGAGLVAIGLAGIWVALELRGAQVDWLAILVPMVVAGFGSGLFIAPNQDFVLSTVPSRLAGQGAGILNTGQRIGSALGIAVIGAALFGTLDMSSGPAQAFTRSAQHATLLNVVLIVICLAMILLFRGASGPKASGSQPASGR